MNRLTARDEFGNADIIGVDSADLQGNLPYHAMNRVTEALNRLAAYEDTGLEPEEMACINRGDKDCDETQICACMGIVRRRLGRLTAYEKAEADGRLIVLPCKVGDTVWIIREKKDKTVVDEETVGKIELGKNRVTICIDWHGGYECFDSGSIGEKLFLTREEAEASSKRI